MKIKTRLINNKWLEVSIYTRKWCKNIVYWGGINISCNTFYPS